MRNGCTCRQGGKGGSAGVGKQVQYTNLPPRLLLLPLPDQRRTPLPVHRLLRKNPGMLEFKRLQMEGQRGIGDGPFLRKMVKLPLPSAAAGTVIDSVRMLPLRRGSFRVPDHLRIRSLQDKISPPLQLFSAGAVDHFIALPVVRYPHRRSPSCIDINSMHTIRVVEALIPVSQAPPSDAQDFPAVPQPFLSARFRLMQNENPTQFIVANIQGGEKRRFCVNTDSSGCMGSTPLWKRRFRPIF